jgi:hypothetical protein
MMSKFGKILGISVSVAFILLGFYVLFGHRFDYLTKQIRVIFAVFLFLYGAWKLTRYILKNPNRDED